MTALLLLALVATPCEPRVQIVGDAALVRPLERALLPRVRAQGGATCPALRVEVQRRDASIFLTIEETSGRRVERTVQDPEFLAPLVESWLPTDLAEPLLLAPSQPPTQGSPVVAQPPPPLVPARTMVEVGALLEFGVAERGGGEIGMALVSALRLGAIEPTLTLRGSLPSRLEEDGLAAATSRYAELLLGARAPFVLGRATLSPGIGIGVGIDDIQREVCLDCGPIILDEARKSEAQFRMEASMVGLISISDASFLQLGLSAGLSPFASGVQELPGWAAESGESLSHLALPAAPRHRLRASIGFGWRGW